MLTTDLVEHVLATIPHRTVGLLGDLFLDRYLDIDPALDEPSVETDLTAYQVTGVRCYPGALGTVVSNLSALGVGRIYPIAGVGDDGEGFELRRALTALPGVALGGVFTAPGRRTPTYTKPMRGTEELNRLDIKNRTPTPRSVEDATLELLDEAWPQLDALIVLDQVSEADCGIVTARVREHLAELAGREPGKFVLADSRERIALFRNVCIKPNEREADAVLAQLGLQDGLGMLLDHADSVGRTVFLTAGADGITVYRPGTGDIVYDWNQIPAYPVAGPVDICGAGDSCSAGITAAMVSGATAEQAAAFGNLVASITVQQIGTTGTASPEQVRQRWREVGGDDFSTPPERSHRSGRRTRWRVAGGEAPGEWPA